MSNKTRAYQFTKEQLLCLVGPRTREVYEAIGAAGALSVSEIQAKLGFASKSIYYQIKKLILVGLIVEVIEVHRRAALYRLKHEGAVIPDGLHGSELELLAAKSITAQLRKAGRAFAASAALTSRKPELVPQTFCSSSRMEIGQENLPILRQRYRELLNELKACPCDQDVVAIQTLFLFAPDLPVAKKRLDH